MISIIVAMDDNRLIGKKDSSNGMPWNNKEDLKHFKEITTGHTIIMGRKTFESLGRVLPNRKHIVLCNDANLKIDNENVEVLNDINLLDKYINSDEENFVIGGATIYKLLLPKADKLYLTKINENFEGDVYFPEIDLDDWKVVSKEKGKKDEKNPYDYEYINFERK